MNNGRQWYWEEFQKGQFKSGICCSILGLCIFTYGMLDIQLDIGFFSSWEDSFLILLCCLSLPLFGADMIDDAFFTFETTDEFVQMNSFSQSKKKDWSEFTAYSAATLRISTGRNNSSQIPYPCYLLSSDKDALRRALDDLKSQKESQGVHGCQLFVVLRDRKYREIYVLPRTEEMEALLKKNAVMPLTEPQAQ